MSDETRRYREAALVIADAICGVPAVRVVPDPPQTHMMHVHVARDPERFARAALDAARETKIWLANGVKPTADRCRFELAAGEATLELPAAEIAHVLDRAVDLTGDTR